MLTDGKILLIMVKWQENFIQEDIFFVTPDVKRGLGFAGILPKYHIVCTDFDPIIPVLKNQGANIFCLEEIGGTISRQIRNSGKLLENPQVLEYIKSNSKGTPKLMYFKPSAKLDILIAENHFLPVGNNSAVNEIYEDKINFYLLARKNFPQYCLPCVTGILSNLNYPDLARECGLPFVLQFGHGWAGNTTFFIHEEKEFSLLAGKFPHTNVKVSKFIEGFTILNNCCISDGEIYISSPAVQIDSIAHLCEKPGVTCGRQWPARFISTNQIEQIKNISKIIGNFMNTDGFRGFFGIDFLIDKGTGQIYISEVNARLTASSAFFTLLEIGLNTIPLMAYHLAEFMGISLGEGHEGRELTGSQIIFRKVPNKSIPDDNLFGVYNCEGNKQDLTRNNYYPENLSKNEYIYIGRNSTSAKPGDEFARIETRCEVLAQPGKFNSLFENITHSY